MSNILIIGGGVIGLAIARELQKKDVGGRITILESGETGREASFAAAGMLAPQAETDRADDFFHFCCASNKLYPAFAEELLEETGVDIELDQSGTLYLAFNDEDVREIRARFDWQKKTGLPIERLTALDVRRLEPFVSPDVREGLFFPNDWQVENRKLLAALHKYAGFNGIGIREKAKVESLLTENGKITGVATAGEEFRAEVVILATGAWTSLIKTGMPGLTLPPVKPIRGQMLGFQTAKRLFTRIIYSPRGYLVPRRFGRILAGATVEDTGFAKEVTEGGVDFIRQNSLEIAPSLLNLEIAEQWAGLRPFAPDGLPVLGELAGIENLFIATAHYRNGILLAPLTARIVAARVAENSNSKYLDIFGPGRFVGSQWAVVSGQ